MIASCKPAEPPPQEPTLRFSAAQKVTIDDEEFWEYMYLGSRIRVPVDAVRYQDDLFPSWPISLSDITATKSPANNWMLIDAINISLRDAQNSGPVDTDRLQFQTAAQLSVAPDETYPDWGLVVYRSRNAPPGVQGYGFWIPAEPSFKAKDGRRLVMRCLTQFSDIPTFPHRLRCSFEVLISDRIKAQVTFDGKFLPDWKRAYDVAMQVIEQRVSAP